jgi:hypothetical protein
VNLSFKKLLDKGPTKNKVKEDYGRGIKMKGDEFKIIFEDINEKFDTLIEGHNSLKEQLDRDRLENKKEHEELKTDILDIKKDIYNLRQDVSEHRNNTELHAFR